MMTFEYSNMMQISFDFNFCPSFSHFKIGEAFHIVKILHCVEFSVVIIWSRTIEFDKV